MNQKSITIIFGLNIKVKQSYMQQSLKIEYIFFIYTNCMLCLYVHKKNTDSLIFTLI